MFYVNQMTVEKDIQYLRESTTLKVRYDDLGSEHLSHDPDSVKSIWCVWNKFAYRTV